jgi:zinc/manganese transport system substrate-binding protein
MRRSARRLTPVAVLLLLLAVVAGCGDGGDSEAAGSLDVIASATFLADIAQNVAGQRFTVRALVPADADLHAYEPTPHDLADVAGADLFIVNGAGLEGTLEDTVRAAAGDLRVVEASAGLKSRLPRPGEPLYEGAADGGASETDPHFWLDPTLVETYVRNLRDAFTATDPAGAATYAANADAYVAKLEALDRRIREQVATVPANARKLVMDHMSYGYFADRYGFTIVGAVIPSVGTGDAPTARQLADLTRTIRDTGARAIFVESGQSPALAEQVAAETGIAVVGDLRDHALSGPDGEAPTYIDMMKFDTQRIVEALR